MFLDSFYSVENGQILISAQQASRFAKEVAGDFNPIHDPDAKRFCVPGDLLFALTLNKYGLSQNMSVTFSGMVGRDKALILPEKDTGVIEIKDEAGKVYTQVEHSGETSNDPSVVEAIIRNYVAFSGHNFPFILVPLMEKHQVMFNPKRPLVIYESMSFELEHLNLVNPELELVETTLEASGKRGDAHFLFAIKDNGVVVGRGDKKLIVSGLMPYDSEMMDSMVEEFNQLKANYVSSK